ncbi:MAG: hypothetical protein LBJ07_04255, partial [Actinomycetes bacterium]|nr:hypothetical protein [Actinomycetes bacterium]
MNSLKDIFSLSWWRDSLNSLTLADFDKRMATISEAIKNPASSPLTFMLLVAIAVVLVFIILLTVVMFVLVSVNKKEQYALVDEEGEVLTKLSEEQATELAAEPFQKVKTGRGWTRFLIIAASALVLWVSFGLTTQTRGYCLACHKSTVHAADLSFAAHEKRSCTSCHETGNVVLRATVNVIPRTL